MDAQLRRGILDVCVLSAIKNEDSYGYKTAQVTLSRDPQSRIAEEPLPSMLYPFEFIVFQDVGDAKPKS